jgi:hypothetical protein
VRLQYRIQHFLGGAASTGYWASLNLIYIPASAGKEEAGRCNAFSGVANDARQHTQALAPRPSKDPPSIPPGSPQGFPQGSPKDPPSDSSKSPCEGLPVLPTTSLAWGNSFFSSSSRCSVRGLQCGSTQSAQH